MSEIFVKLPKRGDYVCKRVSDRKVFYADFENADIPATNLFTVGGEQFEKIGNAIPLGGGKVLCVHRDLEGRAWCDRISWLLSGYTLDGAQHSGVLSIREISDSWVADVEYTVTYSASTASQLVQQLNAFFASTEVFSADNQDWIAQLNDNDTITVHCKFADYRQNNYNKGMNGFHLAVNLMPDVPSSARILRKNGLVSSEGALTSWWRAITYFRNDNAATSYNPANVVTTTLIPYPICLPGYLGTSAHQPDHCAYLRSVYGEGEEGWLRFMESFLPVLNVRDLAIDEARQHTRMLARKTYSSQAKHDEPLCKAAYYAFTRKSETVDEGEFYLPMPVHLPDILRGIKYPSHETTPSDPLNIARYKAKWAVIGNNYSIWSGRRSYPAYAWCAHGSRGFFGSSHAYFTYQVCPVSLYGV